ncbi:MAG: AAC(3) family N-acetyltransferase [Clostridia bacterium]|nr:AAC(3) family N-acetyltransferase [Clostridia bacterium]
MIGYNEIKKAVLEKHLSGKTLCIHSSLKSFGPIDGGAVTIINALMDENCTLVVPTFSYDFEVPPPHGTAPVQNGMDYSKISANPESKSRIYSIACNDISKTMGAVPAAVLSMKNHSRGMHPLNSFASVGPGAKEFIASQSFENVYGPFEKMYAQEGVLVLMGVELTRATAIHFAEKLAGRNLFIRWARNAAGEVQESRVGSCSEGFNRLQPFVSGIEDTVVVGNSTWKIYDFKKFVDVVTEAIKNNPSITHCDDPDCLRCNDMLKGGPIL